MQRRLWEEPSPWLGRVTQKSLAVRGQGRSRVQRGARRGRRRVRHGLDATAVARPGPHAQWTRCFLFPSAISYFDKFVRAARATARATVHTSTEASEVSSPRSWPARRPSFRSPTPTRLLSSHTHAWIRPHTKVCDLSFLLTFVSLDAELLTPDCHPNPHQPLNCTSTAAIHTQPLDC